MVMVMTSSRHELKAGALTKDDGHDKTQDNGG